MRLFEQLKDSWVNDSEEYLEFVATKIRKYTASKKAAVHRAEFDKIFIHGSKVTPDFISIFEYVRSSKLTLLKDFKDVSKPEFSELAERFWQSVEGFSQAIGSMPFHLSKRKFQAGKRKVASCLLTICSVLQPVLSPEKMRWGSPYGTP